MRHALKQDLEEAGMQVCAEVENGAAALVAALREQPDMCLLDVQMEGGDGIAAAGAILAGLPSTRIVLITATPSEDGAAAAAQAGAHGYLGKGLGGARLLQIVRTIADGGTVYA